MEIPPTISVLPQPPPLPSPSATTSIDFSPLEFVLAFVAIITIPLLIYSFIFSIKFKFKCSSSSFSTAAADAPLPTHGSGGDAGELVTSTALKYHKESRVTADCPICLSPFAEDDQVKQLPACKHAFHTCCIDLWLQSHSNCPVCRASVAVKRTNKPPSPSGAAGDADFRQGLPDATTLV